METAESFSEKHQLLAPMEGEWKAIIKMFSPDGKIISEPSGKMNSKMILGGRFLEQNFNGEVVNGQSFNGRGFFGYNDVAKIWQSCWIDDASTQLQTATGIYQANNIEWQMAETIQLEGGGKVEKLSSIRIHSNNLHTMIMSLKDENQQPTKMMEINYHRVEN